MSHEIESHDTQVFGRGVPAWHGLGKVVSGLIDADCVLAEAGLDWTVEKHPLRVSDGLGGAVPFPDKFVTVRTDLPVDNPARYLGVVGPSYTPIQNSETRDIVVGLCNTARVQFETAGSLRNGKRVWFLAVMPESMKVLDDEVRKYVLVRTSHDGSSALEALFTGVRVVCANTLALALDRSPHRVAIRHTAGASSEETVDAARRLLLAADTHFGQVQDVFESMARQRIHKRFVDAYLTALIPDNPQAENHSRTENQRATIRGLFHGGQMGADRDAVRGTRWGLLNAVTEFVDHDRSVAVQRPAEGDATDRERREARMSSVLFGDGARLRQRAFNLMLDADQLLAEAVAAN